jgi:hypothetical protein
MAIAAILTESGACIATDTLARAPYQEGDEELKPLMFAALVQHLPQFKACFACYGHQLVATSFYLFAMQKAVGRDINSLIEIDPKHFADFLRKQAPGQEQSGVIFLFGLNLSTGKMQGYRLPVNRQGVEMAWTPIGDLSVENELVIHPTIEEYADQYAEAMAKYEKSTSTDQVKEIVILQRKADSERPVSERMGIGGEILVTSLGINTITGVFSIITEVVYTWDDYEYQLHQLLIDTEYTEKQRELLAGPVNPVVGLTGREN